jgi:pre-mRNA-splicing factor ATP-dependent RNA helicase DHX15/PRP43
MDRKHKLDLGDIGTKSSDKRIRQTSSFNGDHTVNPWTGRPYSSRYHSILESRIKLPVYAFKDALIETVKANQIIIVEGETGSGTFLLSTFSS